MKEGRKISLLYSVITIMLVVIASVVCYWLSSSYIENLYYDYLSEKAHAVAVERFEEDELDAVRYRNAVLRRQNSIPTGQHFFVNMNKESEADAQLLTYLTPDQLQEVKRGHEVYFKYGDEVGTAFIYYDNEGTYTVIVLSRNPYGREVSRVVGWTLLLLVALSAIVLYLISRLYAIKVVDRIDRNYQAEKLFVNNASHEINNPLTAIQGECEIALLRDRSPEEYRQSLQKIGSETERVIHIMNDLLLFSRTQSGHIDDNSSETLDAGKFLLQFATPQVHLHIESTFPVRVQEHLFSIAIRNLIGNAIKYSGGDSVDVIVNYGLILITDRGMGIPETDQPHIFDPFYRGSNANCTTGHGIGLALSKAIIERFGGNITVNSREGYGTTFKIMMPVSAEI